MGRANRICFPGAVYHIFQRGNNKQDIFLDEFDRWHFLKLFLEAKKRFNYILHCYVLMNNHFHVTVETQNSKPISAIMHYTIGRYAAYFNKKHAREGHLFRERFRDIIVEKDAYLLELSRYIHLNPVKAGFVKLPEKYKWSSYNIYIGLKRDILVDTDAVLGYFKSDTENAGLAYKAFVESNIPKIYNGKDWLEENLTRKRFLGSKDFIKNFQKKCQAPFLY